MITVFLWGPAASCRKIIKVIRPRPVSLRKKHSCIDQGQMRVGLRKIPQQFAGLEADVFTQHPQVVCLVQDIFKQWGAVWASAQDKDAPSQTGGRNAG